METPCSSVSPRLKWVPRWRRLNLRKTAGVLLISFLLLASSLFAPPSGANQLKSPDKWTKKDLKETIATAKTPGDHANIAQYYRLDAERFGAEAKIHIALAKKYANRNARHCQWLATEYLKKAQKELALARAQDSLAKASAPHKSPANEQDKGKEIL